MVVLGSLFVCEEVGRLHKKRSVGVVWSLVNFFASVVWIAAKRFNRLKGVRAAQSFTRVEDKPRTEELRVDSL